MTNAEAICRRIGIVLTNRQKFACAVLEARGLSFCGHFGYQNCEQMAADLWVKDLGVVEADAVIRKRLGRFYR